MAMNGSSISQTKEAVWEGHIWATPVGSPLEKVHAQGLERASSLVQSLIGMNIAQSPCTSQALEASHLPSVKANMQRCPCRELQLVSR